MTDIAFDRLRDVALREAWAHEAHAFTPWLAANIDHISEAIRVPLELTGTEVAVGPFSADILARNPQDDSVVLIENQLEATDHTHLGQIMTYLAGLDAKTVVWIAPSFREPHLSAIRWLNKHTADGFSFFALRLRVVRIGESPFAPIFEAVEKPSGWERQLQVEVKAGQSDITRLRAGFWSGLLQRHPGLATQGVTASAESNKWIPSPIEGIVVGLYLASQTCGIYIRGRASADPTETLAKLLPMKERVQALVGVSMNESAGQNWFFTDKVPHPLKDEARWPVVWDWMAERLPIYLAALADQSGSDR